MKDKKDERVFCNSKLNSLEERPTVAWTFIQNGRPAIYSVAEDQGVGVSVPEAGDQLCREKEEGSGTYFKTV